MQNVNSSLSKLASTAALKSLITASLVVAQPSIIAEILPKSLHNHHNYHRIDILYLGYYPIVTASGEEEDYRYCVSQIAQLNLILPAFHTISYRGSVTTILKLHYHAVPSAIEELHVNESIDMKHQEGTLQRTIVVDANEERLSVSFDVRKFVGPSDLCGYGGIRMFNQIKVSYAYSDTFHYVPAYIPASSVRQKVHQKFVKIYQYFPICANDSLIFERKFYLDFGKTYFVFYDFNSVWNIDVTLHVHPSEYSALYNFEESYCGGKIQMFIFNDFHINCAFRYLKLMRQIPIILQWSRESTLLELERLSLTSSNINGIWPGSMGLTITQNSRNVTIFNSESQLCRSANVLLVTDLASVTPVSLGQHARKQSIPNAESLTFQRDLGNCPFLDQGSHAIILTPSSSQWDSRCISMHKDSSSKYFTHSGRLKYQTFTKGCVSLNAVMTFGMYKLYAMEPVYNIPIQKKWIYYSIAISERCYRGSGINIYFQNMAVNENQAFCYKFSQERHHYVFYAFGITGILYFHLERYQLECSVYIEFTSASSKELSVHGNRKYFKVSVNVIFNYYVSLRI